MGIFLWCFDPISIHGLTLQSFAVTHWTHHTLDTPHTGHVTLYLKTHNTHKKKIAMPPAGFEHTIPASGRPQTHALDGVATGIGQWKIANQKFL
jgi:hypothetical protein